MSHYLMIPTEAKQFLSSILVVFKINLTLKKITVIFQRKMSLI